MDVVALKGFGKFRKFISHKTDSSVTSWRENYLFIRFPIISNDLEVDVIMYFSVTICRLNYLPGLY